MLEFIDVDINNFEYFNFSYLFNFKSNIKGSDNFMS